MNNFLPEIPLKFVFFYSVEYHLNIVGGERDERIRLLLYRGNFMHFDKAGIGYYRVVLCLRVGWWRGRKRLGGMESWYCKQ